MGNYGGYETFIDKLTEYHKNNNNIKYHVACKLNGKGYMDESKLNNVKEVNSTHFIYNNADCFKVKVPEIGSGQAIFYDIYALRESLEFCKRNNIKYPIFYVLACRIGPFIGKYVKQIHKIGGVLYVNPDGHEWMRAKWSKPVRKYWKESERLMIKHADLLVCDSINIEKYIKSEYSKYHPKTTFIAYGADIKKSNLLDTDPKFTNWMKAKKLKPFGYYLIVGRFVPENNFETMIREFMKSESKRSLDIITTKDDSFLKKSNQKLHFSKDSRIKFVGTVYDQELLKKIREKVYGYLHGHSVGELISRKDHMTVIKAFAEANLKNAYYIIAGIGTLKDQLQELIEDLGMTGKIKLLGYRLDVKELVKSCDVFLFSSKQEGLPVALMEAMACGLPCIASNIRGNVDLIVEKSGGYLFPSGNVHNLSKQIIKISNQSEKARNIMGLYNQKNIASFDISNVRKIML